MKSKQFYLILLGIVSLMMVCSCEKEEEPYVKFVNNANGESINAEARVLVFPVESNIEISQLSATCSAEWCDVQLSDKGGDNLILTANIEENMRQTPREAIIMVKSANGQASASLVLTQETSGLTAYYTFDGNCNDQTETGLTPVSLETSFVNSFNNSQAIEITNSSNSLLSFPNSLVDEREMTISFWAKDLSDGHIFHAVRLRDGDPAFILAVVNGMLKFVVTKYNYGWQYNNCSRFTHNSLDGWHMITLVSDFNKTAFTTITTRLYIDGNFVDVVTEGDNVFSESEEGDTKNYRACSKFVMGGEIKTNFGPTIHTTTLTIDNLRFYKYRCLSEDEVKYIYNKERR